MELEQATPVVSIKDMVRSSLKVPEFNIHLKKAEEHIVWKFVEITMKMMINFYYLKFKWKATAVL